MRQLQNSIEAQREKLEKELQQVQDSINRLRSQKKETRSLERRKEKLERDIQRLTTLAPTPVTLPPKPVEPEEARAPVDTLAGVREYNDFFGLYAKSVREKKPFRPLGFIPGPAVIPEFREGGEVRIFAATSDVARQFKAIPTPWMKWEELPEKMRKAIDTWKTIVDGLGYEPTPYHFGLAIALREKGKPPAKHLTMVMTNFRYGPGDSERRFGVTLLPVLEGGEFVGLKVKTFNPDGIPDVPADGVLLKLDELRKDGPVQKMLALHGGTADPKPGMEENYRRRYDRDGNRLQQKKPQSQAPAQQQRPQFKRPTWKP